MQGATAGNGDEFQVIPQAAQYLVSLARYRQIDFGLQAGADLAVGTQSLNRFQDLGAHLALGQLAIVLVFFPLAWWLRHTAFYRWVVVVGGWRVGEGAGGPGGPGGEHDG